jgi:16S rRNA (guanine527-N7)-methyltransferase
MNSELLNSFVSYAKELGFDFSTDTKLEFETYFDEIISYNEKINLMSLKNPDDLIYRHFCDCLYSAKLMMSLKPNNFELKVADLGTGAGLPGIIVKIVFSKIKMILVESITKKCKFLSLVKEKLNSDFEILNTRAEELGQNPLYRSKFDFVLSRAMTKFSPNLEQALPLLKVGGYFIVHKTSQSLLGDDGLRSISNALKQLSGVLEKKLDYKLANQELDYCVLAFKKVKDTPNMFPRKVGIPEKKPL